MVSTADCTYILVSRSFIHCSGSILVLPTVDVPPDTFGNPENWGFLDSNILVYDPATRDPQKGIIDIVLSYLTRLGPQWALTICLFVTLATIPTLPHAKENNFVCPSSPFDLPTIAQDAKISLTSFSSVMTVGKKILSDDGDDDENLLDVKWTQSRN
jgi:hypothetical protein